MNEVKHYWHSVGVWLGQHHGYWIAGVLLVLAFLVLATRR